MMKKFYLFKDIYISMRIKNKIYLFLILILIIGVNLLSAQNAHSAKKIEIEEITPLVTKKIEIEKLLGSPFLENKHISVYNFQLGKIIIWYVSKDLKDNACNWNVPDDTVLNYEITYAEGTPISNIKYDLKDFQKEYLPEQTGYFDAQNGVSFVSTTTEDKKEVVISFARFPSISDKKKCVTTH